MSQPPTSTASDTASVQELIAVVYPDNLGGYSFNIHPWRTVGGEVCEESMILYLDQSILSDAEHQRCHDNHASRIRNPAWVGCTSQ